MKINLPWWLHNSVAAYDYFPKDISLKKKWIAQVKKTRDKD